MRALPPPPAAPAAPSAAALRRRASALRASGASASSDDPDAVASFSAAAAAAHAPHASASPGELSALLALLRARRAEAGDAPRQPGRVHLVGTGPGDPGLLTLSALRLMQRADVVLYDRLVSPEILGAWPRGSRARAGVQRAPLRCGGASTDFATRVPVLRAELVGPGARLVYVGKAAGFHTRTQDEIHELLQARRPPSTSLAPCTLFSFTLSFGVLTRPRHQEFACAGATVVRLKGGDPLVFGRGGEESDYLRSRGIDVAVSPGITAAAGIAAELGIPLTHRGVANSVRFLTGHSREGGEEPAEAVAALGANADAATTLVLYMGLATLPALSAALREAGLDARTPAVAVERGTTREQRRVFARLGGVAAATRAAGLASPTLVIVGHVVALSPLWPFGKQGAEGGEDAYELQEGPVRAELPPGYDDDVTAGDGTEYLTLPGGERLALPRPWPRQAARSD
jgi:uroporphyrin-III C-methyltransferase